jgi:hypothetical protein
MGIDTTLRVGLELDVHQDPVAGLVRDEDGEEHRFSGWLGLAAVLEGLTSEAEADRA